MCVKYSPSRLYFRVLERRNIIEESLSVRPFYWRCSRDDPSGQPYFRDIPGKEGPRTSLHTMSFILNCFPVDSSPHIPVCDVSLLSGGVSSVGRKDPSSSQPDCNGNKYWQTEEKNDSGHRIRVRRRCVPVGHRTKGRLCPSSKPHFS